MNIKRQANRDRAMVNEGVVTRFILQFKANRVGTKRTAQIVARNQRAMWGNAYFHHCSSAK